MLYFLYYFIGTSSGFWGYYSYCNLLFGLRGNVDLEIIETMCGCELSTHENKYLMMMMIEKNKWKLESLEKNGGEKNKTIDLFKTINVYNFKVNGNCSDVFGDSRISRRWGKRFFKDVLRCVRMIQLYSV